MHTQTHDNFNALPASVMGHTLISEQKDGLVKLAQFPWHFRRSKRVGREVIATVCIPDSLHFRH